MIHPPNAIQKYAAHTGKLVNARTLGMKADRQSSERLRRRREYVPVSPNEFSVPNTRCTRLLSPCIEYALHSSRITHLS
jgi:hypothetical protein